MPNIRSMYAPETPGRIIAVIATKPEMNIYIKVGFKLIFNEIVNINEIIVPKKIKKK